MTPAVFTILTLLAVLLFAHLVVIMWLLWRQHQAKKRSKPHHASYLVIYASQSGHAESWAKHSAEQLRLAGEQVALRNIQDVSVTDLVQQQRILWVVSTYGEGDAPDSAQRFVRHVLNQSLDLAHVSFAILALGDQRYPNFCQFGQKLEHWLLQQNAQALFPSIFVNQLDSHQLQSWLTQLEQFTTSHFQAFEMQHEWIELTFAHRQCLNSGSSGAAIYKVQLLVDQTVTWASGDILEIQCENSPAEIAQFLEAHQQQHWQDTDSLRTINLRQYPAPKPHNFSEWLESFAQLPLREYSIASLPEQGLIELVVRQQFTDAGLGLGSGWLTQGLQPDQPLRAHIRHNPEFHLPHDDRPLILIGNGTGIAGLVAHLHQREQWGYKQNWLIFGERQQQFDHLYHAQIQYWQQHGFLQRVDYAFSRDQGEKVYVQDRLKQQAVTVQEWIQQGAAIYVCGSLKGMASGVDQVLNDILGQQQVAQLKREHRYQRDVY